MLTALFVIGMILFGWRFILVAIRAAWGITKVLLFLVLLPLFLIGLFLGGHVYIALPILLILGLFGLLRGK